MIYVSLVEWALIVYVVAFVIGLAAERRLARRLRESPHGLAPMPSPPLSPLKASPYDQLLYLRAVFARRYATHPDPRVRSAGDAFLITFAVFVAAFAVFFWAVATAG